MANEEIIGVKFNVDVSNFSKGLKQVNSYIQQSNSEFKKASAGLDDWASDTEAVTAKIKNLQEVLQLQNTKVELYRKKLEELKNATGDNSKQITYYTTQLNKAEAQVKETEAQLGKYEQSLNETEKEQKDVGDSLKQLNDGFTVAKGVIANLIADGIRNLITGLKNVAVEAFNAGVEFESAFAGVKKTVDATEEEYAVLEQQIIEMSKTLPASASEIAAVAEVAGQLGIKKDDIIAFTKVMIDLGESTVLSAEEAASSLARLANIMGTSSSDYDKLGSVLVDLGNNFATTEAEILEMTMRIAGAGKTIGLTEAEVMGIAAALSSVGIEAEMGGSAISKAMSDIALAVETGNGKFADLATYAEVAGMSSQEFATIMKQDASAAIQAFILGLGNIDDQGGSTLVALQELGFEEVRLRDTMLRASNASDVFTSAIEMGSKAWAENNALTEEANKRYETTESRIAMMKNQITAFGLDIYDKFQEPIGKAVSSVTKIFSNLQKEIGSGKLSKSMDKVAEAFGAFIESAAEFVAKWLKKLINGLADLIDNWDSIKPYIVGATTALIAFKVATSDIVKGIAGFVTGIYKYIAGLIAQKTATDAATASTVALNAATKANLFGLAAGALVGLVAVVKTFSKEAGTAKVQESELTAELEKQRGKIDELTEKTNEAKTAREQLREEAQKTVEEGLSEIAYIEKLNEELRTLVDENGRVKEGYEQRASFIIGELNSALGTELSMTGNVIKGYQDMQTEIDNLIAKEKAYIIWESQKPEYEEAINNEIAAQKQWIEANEAAQAAGVKQKEALDRQAEAYGKLEKAIEDYNKKHPDADVSMDYLLQNTRVYEDGTIEWDKGIVLKKFFKETKDELGEYVGAMNDTIEASDQLAEANTQLSESDERLIEAKKVQIEYERNAELIAQGNYKAVLDRIKGKTEATAKMNEEELRQTAEFQANQNQLLLDGLALAKEAEDQYAIDRYNKEIEENNKSLQNTMNLLAQKTSAVQENSPDVIKAWQDLFANSREQFDIYMKTLSPDLQAEIAMMVNGVNQASPDVQTAFYNLATNSKTSFEEEIGKLDEVEQKEMLELLNTLEENDPLLALIASNLGLTVTDNLDKSQKASESAGKMTDAYGNKIAQDKIAARNAEKLALRATERMNQQAEASKSGENLVWGLNSGLKNTKAQNSVLGNAESLASRLLSKFKGIFNEHSPSKETEEMGKFLVVGLANGIRKFANVALKEAGIAGEEVLSAITPGDIQSALVSDMNNVRTSLNSSLNGGSGIQGNNKVINFTQINNSPKPLSRLEIYRQSKNAVSALGGA